MRLKNIKLAGFKSFADPTVIHFHSNLTGIVGPNGCGKSNIIDAVRWVMGEGSAKQLRSVAMSDVIFSGSKSRKSMSLAAIELLFDNSDGSLGGEYAAYHEIAIRREITREGCSDYFLNNARCRRKDITEIFLGTGLGPNNYAIIEQGMIIELIDAKPEELQSLIEEAAGISKYKEKRRETANRIEHTKTNLSRLEDIIGELNNQLKHLRNQATTANRYQTLKQHERQLNAELHALYWHDLQQEITQLETAITAKATELSDQTTTLHAVEAKTTLAQENLARVTSELNTTQNDYYRLGSNIARLEEQIQGHNKRRSSLKNDLAQIDNVWHEAVAHQEHDQKQLELLVAERTQVTKELVTATKEARRHQEQLTQHEHNLQTWQDFQEHIAKLQQQHEVANAHLEHLKQTLANETQILTKLQNELPKLEENNSITETTNYEKAKVAYENAHLKLTLQQQEITKHREAISKLSGELNSTNSKLQALHGKYASLEALQQNALGKTNKPLNTWLTQNQLNKKVRLAECLKVTPGWETAVTIVLSPYLDAICVEDFEQSFAKLKTLAAGNLSLLNLSPTSLSSKHVSLASKITTTLPIAYLVKYIYIAHDLEEALKMRTSLTDYESIITQQGIWLGLHWVRVNFDPDHKTGILQRSEEIANLTTILQQTQLISNQLEQQLQEERTKLTTLENTSQSLQQELRVITQEYTEAQQQLSAYQTHREYVAQRKRELLIEKQEHETIFATTETQLQKAQLALAQAIEEKASLAAQNAPLMTERPALNHKTQVLKEHAKQAQAKADALKMQLQLVQKQQEYLTQNIKSSTTQVHSLSQHRQNIIDTLETLEAPIANSTAELQEALQKHIAFEQKLTATKQQVNIVTAEIQGLEKQGKNCQEGILELRANLEQLRITKQALVTKTETHLTAIEQQLEDILAGLPKLASITTHEAELASVHSKIERMGPINLAAIAECHKLEERKTYLTTQSHDLTTALTTLETAIRKIDHDTQSCFLETFNAINETFQELFPKIFNGGSAKLITSNTGIIISAAPPGKCNTNIHALSGGEKSLTAIALIFAIFRLNPAPFCMLDEVDAALDDINTIRFSNLLKEMAPVVQFIFISHNKQTIQIANQLAGVTMQEPGVSRIVSVDIQTALMPRW